MWRDEPQLHCSNPALCSPFPSLFYSYCGVPAIINKLLMRGLAFLSFRLRLHHFAPPDCKSCSRSLHSSPVIMSNLSVQLTAPNGRKYTQPIGLFINNEFVAAKSGEKFASINPS